MYNKETTLNYQLLFVYVINTYLLTYTEMLHV